MGYRKNSNAGEYTLATNLVTMQELTAMAAFIRNFKLKYARKKASVVKKKK